MRPPTVTRTGRAVIAVAMMVGLLPAGCASIPPLRLDADAGAREALTGDWVGEYVADEVDGRRGTIVFRLREGEDDARGEVQMRPTGSRDAEVRAQRSRPGSGQTAPPWTERLTIRIVRGQDGSFSGELDSYWDPDRECWARTSFRGTAADGGIAGTFETQYSGPIARTQGRWWIRRR